MNKPQPIIWAKFTGEGGYPGEAEKAKAVLTLGKRYPVLHASISQSSSRITLKEGSFNTVLFDLDFPKLCEVFSKYVSHQ